MSKEAKYLSRKDRRSRFWKTFLVILSVSLLFGGPTYFMYVLQKFSVPYPYPLILGIILFIIGTFAFFRTIKTEA